MAFKAPQPFRPEWGRALPSESRLQRYACRLGEAGARQRPFEIAFHRFEHAQQIVVADSMAEAQVHSLRKGPLAQFGAHELSVLCNRDLDRKQRFVSK
jgi:hypothetical protein